MSPCAVHKTFRIIFGSFPPIKREGTVTVTAPLFLGPMVSELSVEFALNHIITAAQYE